MHRLLQTFSHPSSNLPKILVKIHFTYFFEMVKYQHQVRKHVCRQVCRGTESSLAYFIRSVFSCSKKERSSSQFLCAAENQYLKPLMFVKQWNMANTIKNAKAVIFIEISHNRHIKERKILHKQEDFQSMEQHGGFWKELFATFASC